jgi:hypothetical protein
MKAALTALLVLLALAVGILHLALDFVLFRGNILGRLGPPPGAPPPPNGGGGGLPSFPFGLQLNQMFFANLVVFVVLALLMLAAMRAQPVLPRVVDVLLIAATLYTLYGWNNLRRPNPQGLGQIAVSLEIALIVVAVAHFFAVNRRPVRYAL